MSFGRKVSCLPVHFPDVPLTALRCVDPVSLVSKHARFASFRFKW